MAEFVDHGITGQGDRGIAGIAKGGAGATLTEKERGTHLLYEVKVQIGGKLAQLGQRLLAGTAKKNADEFFDILVRLIEAPVEEMT